MSEVAEETGELEAQIAAEMGADDVDQPADDQAAAELLNDEDREEHTRGVPEGETLNEETGELTPTDESTRRAAQDTEREMEKRAKRIDTAKLSYARKLQEIMADDFEFVHACPLCVTFAPGFRFDQLPPAEVIAATRIEIGMPDFSNLIATEAYWKCETCEGRGRIRTGSTVPGREAATCHTCKGDGFQTALSPSKVVTASPTDQPPAEIQEGDDEGPPEFDPWGRNSKHAGFMKMPYKGMPQHELPDGFAGV